jgi:transcriptional regulator with XRE-family HTH domain
MTTKGAELRRRRQALHLSQAELGDAAGVNRSLVSILETGLAESRLSEALLAAELGRRENEVDAVATPTDDAADLVAQEATA